MSKQSKQKIIEIADLFCGAGGTSQGAVEAIEQLGFKPRLTAINHWNVAVATHTVNHPDARHLCTGVDDVDPLALYEPGQLAILWASPECTHHSVARGGKPVNNQSRATAMCVVRWAEKLQPQVIFIENVREFLDWGPLRKARRKVKFKWPKLSFGQYKKTFPKAKRKEWMRDCPKENREEMRNVWIPDERRKGETFHAWKGMLESLGYHVEWRVLCAADYGDPTTRQRLFVYAVHERSKHEGRKRRIIWPEPTHAKDPSDDLFGQKKPWVSARQIIDWKTPGKSIFNRKKPLAEKTIRRIMIGLEKFGLSGFIIPQQSHDDRVRSAEEPLQTVTTQSRGIRLVTGELKPFIVPNFGEREGQTPRTHDIEQPLPAVTGHGAGGVVQPYLVELRGTSNAHSADQPCPTVTAGGGHVGVVEPYLVEVNHGDTGGAERAAKSLEDPIGTISCKNGLAVCQPYLIQAAHGNKSESDNERRAQSIDKPVGTVHAGGGNYAVAQPYIVPIDQNGGLKVSGATSVDDPLSTVVTKQRHAVAMPELTPFTLSQQSGGSPRSVDEPVQAVATGGAISVVKPFLVGVGGPTGKSEPKSIDNPLNTVIGENHTGVCSPELKPYILPHPRTKGDAPRSIDEPLGTVTATSNDMSVATPTLKPFLMEYYTNGTCHSADLPCPTATTKGRFALIQPIVDGEPLRSKEGLPIIEINGQLFALDIHFRMLKWRELARAQGFHDSYKFTGTSSEITKQIGNAVPRRLARALVMAAMTQQADITDDDEAQTAQTDRVAA